MILRRVIEHVKAQNWTAVALDFVIVVMGVFVGLQAQDWNQSRRERVLEAEYLARMEEDFTALLEREQASVQWNETRIRTTAVVLAALSEGELAPQDTETFEDGLSLLGVVNKPRLSLGVVEELRSTGRISLIRDISLREALNATENEFRWRQKLVEEEAEAARVYRVNLNSKIRIAQHKEKLRPLIVQYDFKRLSEDQELLNELYFIANYQELTNALLKTQLQDIESLRDQVAAARTKARS